MLSITCSMYVVCDECKADTVFKNRSIETLIEDFKHSKWIVDTTTGDRKDVVHFCSDDCKNTFFSKTKIFSNRKKVFKSGWRNG